MLAAGNDLTVYGSLTIAIVHSLGTARHSLLDLVINLAPRVMSHIYV